MKMKHRAFAFALAAAMALTGCGAPKQEIAEEPPKVEEPVVDPVAEEISAFFKQYVDTNVRPVAVMVDNDDKNARPQAGLDEAYLIYELIVEGGATRFMALFRDDVEKIGPCRSSRHYFLDFMMENGALYTHYGWSPKAAQDISAFGIEKINGVLGGDGNTFWREEKYKGDWHSAYTSMEKIKAKAAEKGFSMETDHKNGIKYSDKYSDLPAENVADDITLKYSDFYNTGYKYNAEAKLYEKQINGNPHVMQSGETVKVKNIIIELIGDVSLGDGSDRRDMNTTGSGEGYYITNGAYEKITWSKSSRQANTVYKKADGSDLLINPGKTIVNVISPNANITLSKPAAE